MSAVRAGALLAAVVAGPPLYGLVQSGDLAWTAALEKGGIVAAACVAGAAAVGRIATAYEQDTDRQRRLAAADQAIAEAEAVVHERRALQAQPQGGPTP